VKEIEKVKTKEDFTDFLKALSKDFDENENQWENINIRDYLESIAAWIKDWDDRPLSLGRPIPKDMDWQMIAFMFAAGKYYE